MQLNTSDPDDVVKTFSNLKVCEDNRPTLKEIPSDSPRIRSPASPKTSPDGTPKRRMGSEGTPEKTDVKQAQVRFNKLVKKAKYLAQEGKVQQALELNREALKIHHHEKLARRIAKMEEYLKNYGDRDEEEEEDEEETEGGMIQLGSNSGFYLHKDLNAKLYNHQKQGVLWMWDLHRKKKGGILGDDMGLGKTIQVIAFLSGLFDLDKVRTVMIVLPVSVMINWEKEFNKWAPGIAVYPFHGTSKRERERNLARVQRRGGVLLTTYGMVLTSSEQMSQRDGRDFVWDYVVLDEGHKIKNPSKTTKAVYAVTAKHRLILSGTPIQNNLKELWTLFDYVHQGSLLGTLRTFKMEFENPIIRARERDATAAEKRLGLEMASSLKNIIDPFFMRRTKAEVKEEEKKDTGKSQLKSLKMPTMSFKNDFVVWLYLSDTQLAIYRDFLELASVKELLMSSKSPLVALTVLKKICDHPRLLSLRACHQLGLHGQEMVSDELEMPSSLESAVTKIDSIDDSVLLEEAGKMGVVVSLVNRLREEGHRALIFSQSRKILDIIQKVLKNKGHKVVRLDGTVRGVMERDELVQKFQNNSSYSVFLLTTQVGGVGLTLTAADRVIIYDPSWNPATDAQAVDRAFRIGQTKNVVIYRLITCGTVEEKIYRRQIFKDSITRQTTGNTKDPYRYFTKQELRELFQLGDHRLSNTQKQLEDMHRTDRRRDPELDDHIAFLHSLDIFGISDHDLMFSQESPAHEIAEDATPDENTAAPANAQHDNYIKFRVQKAKDIIKQESSVPGTMEQRMKSGFQMTSVYNLPENQALMMKDVPVFQPRAADNARFMPNRPGALGGAGVNVFHRRPQDTTRPMFNRPAGGSSAGGKPPQMIIVYPPKPIKPQVEAKPSSSGSSNSEPIDLTLDGDGGDVTAAANVTGRTLSHSGGEEEESKEAAEGDEEPVVNLPRVEKRKKGDRGSRQGAGESAGQPQALSESAQSSSEKSPSPSAELSPAEAPVSPQRSEAKPDSKSFTTPPTKGRPEHVVQEELIISPSAYTPLMMMRQKRRRIDDAPVEDLSKALSATVLVEESPETTTTPGRRGREPSAAEEKEPSENETPDEIASFLAEDDLDIIQDSLVEDYANNSKAHSPPAATAETSTEEGRQGVTEYSSSSDSTEEGRQGVTQHSSSLDSAEHEQEREVRSKRRRSVCRRVAVIESSEDELEDDENKENLHPSFSNASHQEEESLNQEEDMNGDEQCEQEGEEEEEDVEGEEGEEEIVEGEKENVEEGSCSDTEERDGKQQPRRSIEIYDDSMAENREDEQDEEEEEEEKEEEVDVELLKELLRVGKQLYRQKQYPEALEKCQAALAMVYDPQLQAMIDKIQGKIDQGL